METMSSSPSPPGNRAGATNTSAPSPAPAPPPTPSIANKDGETNFLEFATGQNPNAATPARRLLVKNGANLEFTYTRSKAAVTDGVTFAVEWSDTLAAGSWSSVGEGTLLTDNGTLQTMKATFPPAAAASGSCD